MNLYAAQSPTYTRQKYFFYSMVIASAIFIALGFIDSRILDNGDSVWTKPLRFSLAIAIHAVTMIWLHAITRRYEVTGKWFRISMDIQLVMLAIEMVCIVTQAVRGVHSHFNHETAFDAALYQVMALAIGVLTITYVIQAWNCFRHPGSRPVVAYATTLGFIAALIGAGVGVAMNIPTAEQSAMLAQGQKLIMEGSHYVNGGSDVKAPFFAWDMKQGDWRITHFIGLHGIQLLPLLGLAAFYARRQIASSGLLFGVSAFSFFVFLIGSVMITANDQSILNPLPINAIFWAVCWMAPIFLIFQGYRGYHVR